MRYSAMRQLDWYRRYSYHSKDMDAAQEYLSRRLGQSVMVTGHQVRKCVVSINLTEARSP